MPVIWQSINVIDVDIKKIKLKIKQLKMIGEYD